MAPLENPVIATTERVYDGYRTTELSCPGTGPTIILLHGILDLPQTWSQVLGLLAASGHRAVAVSLPQPHERPVGTSVVPRQDAFVAAVAREHADTDGVVLVGNSMGAGLALRAALNPDLPVLSAIALDPIGFGVSRWISLLLQSSVLRERLLSEIDLPRSVLRPLAPSVIRRIIFARPDVTCHAEAVADQLAGIPVGAALAGAYALLSEFAPGYSSSPTIPILFVHGRRDNLIPWRASLRGHRQFPGSELRLLPDSGHCPQVDEPHVVTDLILEFATRARRVA